MSRWKQILIYTLIGFLTAFAVSFVMAGGWWS